MANRIYLINTLETALAFDFDGNAQASDNQDLSSVLTSPIGAYATNSRIYVADEASGSRPIRIWDLDFNRQAGEEFNLQSSTNEYGGICVTDTRLLALNNSTNTVEFYTLSGTYQSSENQTVDSRNYKGFTRSTNRFVLLSVRVGTDFAYFYDTSWAEQTSEHISVGDANFGSAITTDTRYYFISNNNATAYDLSRNPQTDDDFTFTGAIQAGFVTFEQSATLTLSTTDTDIRAGEPVDIDIDSDIDISNFVASDCTVTNGTRGALTINSATSATLRVTAGSAGTMTVAIALNAVDPGNAAVSQDFTVNARVTATITFDDSEGISGGSTGVNIAFGESVTDLRLSDLSTTAGTLSLVTGSGTSWAATLAFPATGSGTATVSLAEDSTTPQNASSSATIDYAEAAVALALGWTVPTAPIGNTFSATLTSNHPITGVELNDFRFRISDNSEGAVALTAANTTISAVAGTNNWQLDIVLVGTFDADYTIRLRGNTVQYDGSNYPPAFLFSDAFSIDSGLDTPDDAVLNITLDATSVEQGEVVNALFTYDSAITNFTAADVDVTTGAIKGALTDNSDNTFSMPITAPSTGSGNISVSVAEDVVSPGNNADSASFAYTAPVIIDAVLNITLDATTVENSGIVNATFTFDSAVTGFTAGDVVVTFGATKGTLTNQGNNVYTMPITAPSTGSGTITVRVAVDRVSPGNNADSATFAYTEPTASTAPGAPTSLGATAQTSGTSMALAWTVPSDDGGESITDYDVSSDDGVTWASTGSTFTAYTLTGLDKGTEYIFRVRAVNSVGNGTASTSVTETTATTRPGAPTSLSASVTSTTADLSWTAPTDDGGSPITEYQYRFTTGTTAGGTWTDTNSTATSVTISSLTADTEYTFQVRTVTTVGSSQSNPSVTETTLSAASTVPGAPTSLTPTAQTGGTSMALAWTVPTDTGSTAISDYDVSSDDGATWVSTGSTFTAYTVTGLDKGTEYTFRVRAVNSVGNGTASASVTETTLTTRPSPPTNLTVSVAQTTADLSWTAPTDTGGSPITEYQYRFTTGTTAGGTWTDTNSTTPSFTISSLTADTQYTFQVRTLTSVGNSQSNPSVTETTLATAATVPGAPTSLSATAQTGGTSVELDWTAPTNTGGAAISDYDVRYQAGATAGGTWTSLGQTTTSYTQTGLDKGTQYTFQVRAVNSVGDSAASSSDTTTTLTTVPGAPTSLSISTDATSADFSWTAPTDTGGAAISDYDVSSDDGATWNATGSTSTTYTLTGLDSETEYDFRVRAVNSVGDSAASSAVTESTTAASTTTTTGGEIHIADNTGNEIGVIAPDTADGQDAVALRVYDLPTVITTPHAALVDGDGNLHIADTSGDEVAVIATDTADGAVAVALRIYDLPTGITSPRGMVLDGDGNIHVVDTSGDEVAVISPNTADGQRAVAIRTYDLPTGTAIPSGLTIDADGNIHVVDSGDDNIRVYDPNTADGQRAVAIRTYDLPVNLGNPEGLTTDGDGNIHVVDISNDNVEVIAPDTADGQRAVALRTYGMPTGITAPQGLAFVPGTETDVENTVPSAPTSLSVTTTRTTAILTWTAPTDDGGTPITEYQYRFIAGSTAGGTWTDTNSTAVTVTISSLDPSTEYTFQVRAVNSVGNSDASSAVTESTSAESVTSAIFTITPEVLTIAAGETADIDITSDISVDGLTAADISADAGTLGSLVTNSATSYTIPLTAPATGSGTITITIQADAVTQSNAETTATVDYAEPQDRVFLFSRTSGRFHSFTFDGTAEATENINTGETTIQGAAADDTHIYAHNNFTGILRWNIVGARDTAGDFQVNSTTDTYKGLAVTDTHIVLLNFTLRQLEYYDKAAGADYGTYDSTLTVSVGTTGSFTGLCRGGDNLFVGNNQGDVISILTLAGAADSTFTASTTNTQALFVIDNRLHVLDIVGTTDAYDLTGNAETSDDIAFSNGAFLAAFVTFAPTTSTDNTVPGAPTSLSGTAAATSMALSWAAPTDNGGATISDYELRYQAGSTAGGTWTALGQTTTSYTQASLDKGTEYTFQVRAVNSVGNSDASTAVTETTLTTVPGAPTSLTVTPDQTSVDLSWAAPTDTGGTTITEYQYRFTTGSSAGGTWTDTDSTTTSQTITGLDADTEYTFQVRAVNSVGNSAASTAVTETTDAETLITAPNAPTSLSATAQTGGTSVELDWTAPSDNGGAAITDYETSSDDGTTWVSTSSTVTTYTVTGLDKGTEYTFQVRAINSAGNGTASTSVTETTATTVPGAPTSLDATVTRTTAALSWTAPVDTGGSAITEYQYRFTTGTTAGGTWTDTNSTAASVTISSLTANTEYTFQVRTVTTVGSSQSNPSVTETTSSQSAPSAPQNLSVTAQTGGTSVELDWDAPTDTGGSAVTDYDVSSDNGTTWASTGDTATAYTLTGLDKGTEYNFRVRAVNAQGDGTASTAVTETTLTTVPDAPTSLTVDAGADSADLSWTAPNDDGGSDITGYQYRYQAGTTAGGTWTDTGSATVAFTVSSLDAETEYTFQVRAVNSAGNSAASNAVTATTDAIAETQAQVSTEATYNADLGYNEIPEALGALKKISSSGTVESLGNLWYEERPYNISATRALSIDGSLHLTMGYGEPDAVLRSDSLASQSDNVQHLVYGKALHYVVPSFESGGSLYDALADIAQRINATLSIDKGIITISDRRPYEALVDGATGTGTGNLDFDSETKTFPASGYLIIDYEFIRYTGISSVAFTGVSRGVIGTTIVDHADTAEIVYVDAVIRPNLIKGDLGYINDVNRIYNIIRNPSGTVEVRDPDSIARYGELPYTLDLGLTDHDRAWQQEVFDRYLQDLKDLHRLIDVSVQPGKDTLGLQLGQIIGFRYSSLVYAGRVVAITYGSDAIGLRVRTL